MSLDYRIYTPLDTQRRRITGKVTAMGFSDPRCDNWSSDRWWMRVDGHFVSMSPEMTDMVKSHFCGGPLDHMPVVTVELDSLNHAYFVRIEQLDAKPE